MLEYNGLIECIPPLAAKEIQFLNEWQKMLNEIYQLKEEGQENKESAEQKLDQFLGISLTEAQRWTICQFCYSPMINWTEKGIEIKATHKKGQLRESILAYLHLLLGENPVIKNSLYKELSFLQKHSFNGIIDSYKLEKSGNWKHWLYIIENNEFYSVNGCSLEEYQNDPNFYTKEKKIDTCIDKLEKYFPPLYLYAQVVKEVYGNEKQEIKDKKQKL